MHYRILLLTPFHSVRCSGPGADFGFRGYTPRTNSVTSRPASTRAWAPTTWISGCGGFTATPHHAGSAATKQHSEYLSELLESWGYDVSVVEYDVVLPTPRTRQLELTAPTTFTASLTELPVAGRSKLGAIR